MPRICLVLETEEESGSDNLIPLLKQAKEATGEPDFLFCMDSGCIDYEQLWLTSSLRGVAMVDIEVKSGINGYHSGEVGGIVPETFRILRLLLDRLDDSKSGSVCQELQVETPKWKDEEAEYLTKLKGMDLCTKFPILEQSKYAIHEGGLKEMYLENVWRANLSITGCDGLPPIAMAGNVVRSSTSARLSMRLSPIQSVDECIKIITDKVTKDVPYGAQVTVLRTNGGPGWCMKMPEPWLDQAIKQAGADFFDGKPTGSYGEGGSIPFLKELEGMYPQT
jgi:acetylornithine deacetylase/succinyl-diaminopimelate desuccinylase-like protein